MALALQIELMIDSDGDVIYITDKTGVYDAETNTGGYGTPNFDLNDLCLALYVEREDDTVVLPEFAGTDQLVYDDIALNTKETNWQILVDKDGRYRFWLFQLGVSLDNVNFVSGGAIPDNTVYYNNTQLYQMVNGTGIEWSGTLADLKDSVDYTQVYGEDFFQPEVHIKLWTLYNKILTDTSGDCDVDKLYDTYLKAFADMQGADWAYRTNLTTKAREINEKNIATLIKAL